MTPRLDDTPAVSDMLIGLVPATASGAIVGAIAVALAAWLGSACQ